MANKHTHIENPLTNDDLFKNAYCQGDKGKTLWKMMIWLKMNEKYENDNSIKNGYFNGIGNYNSIKNVYW